MRLTISRTAGQGQCTVPTATSSQVLCGPEICCKSLADFFLIRNIPKECDSRSLIFPVPIGKYVPTLFILQGEIFSKYVLQVFMCSCSSNILTWFLVKENSQYHPMSSLLQSDSEISPREVSKSLKKLSMLEEVYFFLRHKLPHLNTTTVCVIYSHSRSLF